MISAPRDANRIVTLMGTSSVDGVTPVLIYVDPITHRVLVDPTVAGSVAWGNISGTLSDQTDLQTALNAKQATLVSGTTIKTINGASILASGDLTLLTSLSGAVLTDQTVGQTIGATGARLTKLWATDITVTNAITGSVTGNAGTATILANGRTLWGQSFDGSGNVTGSLTSVGDITGGASSMTITAGTGNSRTLTLQTTTSGGVATTAVTIDATQNVGIGMSPVLRLDVTGSARTISEGLAIDIVDKGFIAQRSTNDSVLAIGYRTTPNVWILAATYSSTGAYRPIAFATSDSERLRIHTSGGISIGNTTDPGNTNLSVTGTVNKLTLTPPATGSTLTIIDGKTLTINKTLTLDGTDSTTMTFPSTSATIARTDAAQTFAGTQTYSNAVIYTNNAITASGNAATVPVTARLNTVTNNSAATLTVTMATASAVDGQLSMVRILDFSAATQTITWVNTEDSTVTAPTTSNGSTTLFLSALFMYNGGTSKWRCIGKA